MLSQALAGALQNPLLAPDTNAAAAASSSGTSLNNQTSDETANALATNMAAQIEAMNKKVEEGMAQLRFESKFNNHIFIFLQGHGNNATNNRRHSSCDSSAIRRERRTSCAAHFRNYAIRKKNRINNHLILKLFTCKIIAQYR